jgi:hypothetical protein
MVLRTVPVADPTTTPPTVYTSGNVAFNACKSQDPDPDDRMNWQFHFGDSGKPAWDEGGRFVADFARVCRVEHEYAQGVYVATVRVTDKHLSDQGGGVVAMAATTQQVRIVAGDASVVDPPTTRCDTMTVGFEGLAVGTPGPSLFLPGITFSSDAVIAVNDFSWGSPANTRVIGGNAFSFSLAEPRDDLRLRFAASVPGWAVTVYGMYKGQWAFSRRLLGVEPPGASWQEGSLHVSSTPFDHVFLTSSRVWIDDLVMSCP